MKGLIGLVALLFGTACSLPPKDPFAAAERALRHNDLLRALQAYDAVPVAHARYPDARAASGDVEQRMRRCHELILEALMLRAEWRDAEALVALRRASDHWPGQPSLNQWIAATEKRLQLFGGHWVDPEAATPMVEVAKIGEPQASPVAAQPAGSQTESSQATGSQPGQSQAAAPITGRMDCVEVPAQRVPQPLLPMVGLGPSQASSSVASVERPILEPTVRVSGPSALANVPQPGARRIATAPSLVGKSPTESAAAAGPEQGAPEPAASDDETEMVANQASTSAQSSVRWRTGEDPVALGLVSVEGNLSRGELTTAVRDLIELARRFPTDLRVNRRLGRLLHQRALMHYGQGAVAAAVADWQRVLEIEPGNTAVQHLLERALLESQSTGQKGRD